MKSVDNQYCVKYFSQRRNNSKCSLKNKTLVESLEKQGLMTDFGNIKIEETKQNGQWDKETQPSTITDKQFQMICDLIKQSELAYTHFQGMSLLVKKHIREYT